MLALNAGDGPGPHEVEAEIGRGGMAVVYRARQPSLARLVAVKALSPALARDADFVARFHPEATIAAGLEHPQIVPIYDVGEAIGIPYLATRVIPARRSPN